MKITLSNDYHNTQINLVVKPCAEGSDCIGSLSASQVRRARRTLCGVAGCKCGDDLGRRGPQEHEIEPTVDSYTGIITGAIVY